jgi:hypothetical protein
MASPERGHRRRDATVGELIGGNEPKAALMRAEQVEEERCPMATRTDCPTRSGAATSRA